MAGGGPSYHALSYHALGGDTQKVAEVVLRNRALSCGALSYHAPGDDIQKVAGSPSTMLSAVCLQQGTGHTRSICLTPHKAYSAGPKSSDLRLYVRVLCSSSIVSHKGY